MYQMSKNLTFIYTIEIDDHHSRVLVCDGVLCSIFSKLSLAFHFIFGKSMSLKKLKQLLQFYYSYDNAHSLVAVVSL